jgi:hypothetical protein
MSLGLIFSHPRESEAIVPNRLLVSAVTTEQSDNVAIARRLVGLLPMHGHPAAQPSRESAEAGIKKYVHAIMLLACLALAAAILSGVL